MRTKTLAAIFTALLLTAAAAQAQQVQITVHIFTGGSTNHGQLLSSWQDRSGLTTSTTQAYKGLVLQKATVSADLGIPYAKVNGFSNMPLKSLGFDVRSQQKNGFSGEHCNASPTIEVTLTNGTTYAFFCNGGNHTAISNTAWDRVRFTDADATPISCHGNGCVLEPWPGFGTGAAIVAAPTSRFPSLGTFLIIMFDGYDSAPDFTGVAYMDNVDINGTLIGDGNIHTIP